MRALLFALPFCCTLPSLPAQAPGPSAVQAVAEQELAALQSRYEASPGDQRARYEEYRPLYEDFARRHAGSEPALSARLWLLNQTWWLREGGTMHETARSILEEILADHPSSPQLAQVMEYGYVLPAAERSVLYERILELTPHEQVKAAALLGMGKEGLRSQDPARREQARRHLQDLAERYGDLAYRHSRFRDMAEAYLHPLDPAALAVGQVAPEIVGADHLGRPMKLSDFRGKVVVLDFWGHW